MAADMRRLALLLPLALAACQGRPSVVDPDDTTMAHAAGPTSSQMAETLRNQNHPQRTSPAQPQAPGTQAPPSSAPSPGISAPVAVDSNQKREYADVYVDLTKPDGQKELVSYLMKPDEWHIQKVVQLSPTQKHWRFWRVARTDGKAMPDVDPLRPRTTSTTRP